MMLTVTNINRNANVSLPKNQRLGVNFREKNMLRLSSANNLNDR